MQDLSTVYHNPDKVSCGIKLILSFYIILMPFLKNTIYFSIIKVILVYYRDVREKHNPKHLGTITAFLLLNFNLF